MHNSISLVPRLLPSFLYSIVTKRWGGAWEPGYSNKRNMRTKSGRVSTSCVCCVSRCTVHGSTNRDVIYVCRVSVSWPGLWTGLDWTDQNSCIQTANITIAMKGCFQLCLKLLLSLLRHRLLDFREVKSYVHIQHWAWTIVMDDIGIFLYTSADNNCSSYPSSMQSIQKKVWP